MDRKGELQNIKWMTIFGHGDCNFLVFPEFAIDSIYIHINVFVAKLILFSNMDMSL